MYYVKRLYDFFDRLARNNDRQWFAEHRAEYDELRALWLADIDRMIRLMAEWEPALWHLTARQCAYRIYRDTRFSPDKTPYKTFFSASFGPYGKIADRAGFYIELGRPRAYDQGIYGGIWCPSSRAIATLRHAIVDNIEEWDEIVREPAMQAQFPGWCSTTLKTIPKGWDRNHPQAEYLRMKDYGKFHPCDDAFYLDPAWPERAAELMRILKPLIDFLNYSLDE